MRYLLKIYLALLYDALLMLALSTLITVIYLWLIGDAQMGTKRFGLQLCIWLGIGSYCVQSWVRSGQTLASQTWRLIVVDTQGNLLGLKIALLRYLLASLLALPLGLAFWWALLNREHLFLHDRLLGSRVQLWHQD